MFLPCSGLKYITPPPCFPAPCYPSHLRQGLKLVEQRCDHRWIDGHEEERQRQHEAPEVQCEVRPANLWDASQGVWGVVPYII